MKRASPYAWLALVLATCFTLATTVELRRLRADRRSAPDSPLKKLLGEGRRMFANQFFVMADVYLHSGYYPSIFDQRNATKPKAIVTETTESPHDEHDHDHDHEHEEDHETEHEKEMDFLGAPKDWIERFGRRFRITEHTHLEEGREREILPFLQLAADLDPQMIETYTVAAYWLRTKLRKTKEAEAFLRDGLRNNPGSYEILFELGRLYREDRQDADRARNIWLLALRRWSEQSPEAKQENLFAFDQITVNLAFLEETAGNWQRAVQFLEMAKQASPNPEALQKRIDAIKAKNSRAPTAPGNKLP